MGVTGPLEVFQLQATPWLDAMRSARRRSAAVRERLRMVDG